MPSVDKDLIAAVWDRNTRRVKAALGAGASVAGSPGQTFPPIVAATMTNYPAMVALLLEQGADPDKPVTKQLTCPRLGPGTTNAGERALAIAARSGQVETVRLLLKQSRADPNATDNTGRTALLVTCLMSYVMVEVVRLLLEAGADPTLADKDGYSPLHFVALKGHTNLVDMLYSRAPAALNRFTIHGVTPLFMACGNGHESTVSKLLSLGATQRMPLHDGGMLPLSAAADNGFVGVVRVLLNEGGLRAAEGGKALAKALHIAVRFHHAKILRLLLTVDREEGRSELANINLDGTTLLHCGAGYCYPTEVSILLEAGADEAVRDSEGHIPQDVIGVKIGRDDTPRKDRTDEVAIRRMLQRGPAYRARSWAWPSGEVDAGGHGDGDTAAATAASVAVLSFAPAVNPPPVIGVRIFRPKEKGRRKFFVRFIGM